MKPKALHYEKNVLLVDESKFNTFGLDERVLVWRRPTEEFRRSNLRYEVFSYWTPKIYSRRQNNIKFIQSFYKKYFDQISYSYVHFSKSYIRKKKTTNSRFPQF